MSLTTKCCTTCKLHKPLKSFYNSSSSKDGKSYRCKSCDSLSGKVYKSKHKERDRIRRKYERLKRVYGLSKEDYDKLWKLQDGKCPICNCKLKEGWTKNHDKNRAVVDHCHKTNRVRGLLCTMCNKGIGLLGDTKESLMKALKYLNKTEVH